MRCRYTVSMAPLKEKRESDHIKFLSPKTGEFKVYSVPKRIASFSKAAFEAQKSGDIATQNQLKDIWPSFLKYKTGRAMQARNTYISRLRDEARIRADYGFADVLSRLLCGVRLEVGTSEWNTWVEVTEKQNFDFTPSEEDDRRRWLADVMDKARSLRLIHLHKLYCEEISIGSIDKASVLLQAMRDPLQFGSAECQIWVEKAKEYLTNSRPEVPGPIGGEVELDFLCSKFLKAMENGDQMESRSLACSVELHLYKQELKLLCERYIEWLYQDARIKGDYARGAQLLRALGEVRTHQRVQDWEKWLPEARFELEVSLEALNQRRKYADAVDRARLLRKCHLDTLFHEAVRFKDNFKAAEIAQAMTEPLKEDSEEWRIWVNESKKYIPDSNASLKTPAAYDVPSLRAYERSFWEEVREQCANVEDTIRRSGRPNGWIDLWREGGRTHDSELEKCVRDFSLVFESHQSEMENAYSGEQVFRAIKSLIGPMKCLNLSPRMEAAE